MIRFPKNPNILKDRNIQEKPNVQIQTSKKKPTGTISFKQPFKIPVSIIQLSRKIFMVNVHLNHVQKILSPAFLRGFFMCAMHVDKLDGVSPLWGSVIANH